MSPPDDSPESLRRNADAPSDPVQLTERAEALNDAGDYLQALELLEGAIEAEPDFARAFVARAWALENLGPEHDAEAEAAYEKAIALDPTNPWGLEGVAHRLELDGNVEEAKRLYRQAISANRDASDPDVLEIIAWCHHRLGDETEAERVYRRALEIDPTRAATRFDLGLTLFMIGRGADGRTEVEAALRSLEGADPRVRGTTIQVALDDLQEAELLRPELAAITDVGRVRVEMEAALSRLPDP
ncbi:MAG: tetratricopeptide repeat protein [Actinomycetota bacterium]